MEQKTKKQITNIITIRQGRDRVVEDGNRDEKNPLWNRKRTEEQVEKGVHIQI